MKQLKRCIQVIMCSLILMISCKMNVWAAGNSISFSDPTAEKGETIIITVKIVSDTTAFDAVDMTIVYDDSALEFTGGSSVVTGGSGKLKISGTTSETSMKTISYDLTFTALKTGNSALNVSDYKIVGVDKKTLTMDHVGSSSITVKEAGTVTEKAVATATPEPTRAVTATPAVTNAVTTQPEVTDEAAVATTANEEDNTIRVNDKVLTPLALPSDAKLQGYTNGTLEYRGETMEALVSDYMELYVVYMKDTNGEKDYYVYYKDVDQFTEFIKIDNGGDKFIVVLDGYPRDISVYGFERTTIMINDKKVGVAWKYTDELIAYSSAAAEYYLVGGLSESGVNTWYVYDFVDGTYQRYFVQPANLIEEESGPDLTLTEQEQQVKELNEALQRSKSARFKVIGALAFAVLILLMVVINMFLKMRILKEEIRELEEDGERENDFTTSEKRTVTPQKRKEPKVPVERRKETAADDEFFDEADVIPSEMEEEIIKAKISGKESEEDEFEESLKLRKSKPKQKKTPKVEEKVFNEEDFDFEFINLDDEDDK